MHRRLFVSRHFPLSASLVHPRYSSTTSTTEDVSFCDVLVLGGGMVGGALACFLGNHPAFRDKRTIVLERGKAMSAPLAPDAPWTNRVCELSPASVNFLRDLGVWDLMKRQRVKRVTRMQVWDAASDSYIVFDANEGTSDDGATSWTVENDVTTRAIESRLVSLADGGANVEIRHEAAVSSISFPGDARHHASSGAWPRVTLKDGTVIESRLIVGADGANSAARHAANIKTWDYDFNQTGVVATVKLEQAFGNTVAWQRFLASGPIAVLPLDDFHSSLVWSVSDDEAKRLVNLEEDAFAREVNDAVWAERDRSSIPVHEFAKKYSDLLQSNSGRQIPPKIVGVQVGSRGLFPLKLAHAVDYVKPYLALVGDAAHRIHPMAGQGVNLGFGDAAKLGEILVEGASRGADLGSTSLLTQYETSRQRKVVPLIAGLQALHLLYGSTWTAVVALRAFGLQSVDAFPVLKKAFAKYAMEH